MYESELMEFGFTRNEAKVYLSLLNNNVMNPKEIAEKTGLHRSNIYDILEKLIEKGFVSFIFINKKKYYQAVDPAVIKELFKLKIKRYDEIYPRLKEIYESSDIPTKVEIHRGKRVYSTLLKTLLSDLSEGDVIYFIGINEELIKNIEPILIEQYFKIIKDKNVVEKIIIKKGSPKLEKSFLKYKEID